MSKYTIKFCNRHWVDIEKLTQVPQYLPTGYHTLESGYFENWEQKPTIERNAHFTIEKDGEVIETYFDYPSQDYDLRYRKSIPPATASLTYGVEVMGEYESFMDALQNVPHNYLHSHDPQWEELGIDPVDQQEETGHNDYYIILEDNGGKQTPGGSVFIAIHGFYPFHDE